MRLRAGDRVLYDNEKPDKFPGFFNFFKLQEATGKVLKIKWASSCMGCCIGYDWHYNAICRVTVWWTWPCGKTSLSDHKPDDLIFAKREKR